jgi:hypothetical protein
MRVYEVLIESTTNLKEGPKVDAVAGGIGKVAGTAVRGVKSLAKGTSSAWQALKKGYQTGKAGGVGGSNATSTPTTGTATTSTPTPAASSIPSAGSNSTTPAKDVATAPVDDNQTVDTPTGKVKLKDIKTAMSSMKKPQLTKIKSAIDKKLQKAA